MRKLLLLTIAGASISLQAGIIDTAKQKAKALFSGKPSIKIVNETGRELWPITIDGKHYFDKEFKGKSFEIVTDAAKGVDLTKNIYFTAQPIGANQFIGCAWQAGYMPKEVKLTLDAGKMPAGCSLKQ